jgi:Kelch motif protein
MSRLIDEILLLLPFLSVVFISILSSSASAQSWSEGADMPTARSEITATNIGDEIFVIGGFDISGNPLDVVEVYNVKDDSWKSTASLPKPLHHTAAASYDGKIYVTGGLLQRNGSHPINCLFMIRQRISGQKVSPCLLQGEL